VCWRRRHTDAPLSPVSLALNYPIASSVGQDTDRQWRDLTEHVTVTTKDFQAPAVAATEAAEALRSRSGKHLLTVSATLRPVGDAWAALADPTRRSIFELVAARPRAVVDIARELPVSRPAVSQHLKLLKTARLVVDHAEGSRRIYRADPAGLRELRAQLDRFWNEALANFKELVEGSEEDA